ncbi:hypothetical protein FTUN_2466 [Frigoriglobus tundricola]|uniref:Uncharacterized protein n=1 Tax=Frigoriglobus tundricola TaxID=2774151 RepID=A0A6M5YNJ6_9BACT|nr:hypothetical protein FTUN_2466 [Frigoriglobus tundricola]
MARHSCCRCYNSGYSRSANTVRGPSVFAEPFEIIDSGTDIPVAIAPHNHFAV